MAIDIEKLGEFLKASFLNLRSYTNSPKLDYNTPVKGFREAFLLNLSLSFWKLVLETSAASNFLIHAKIP